MGRTLPEQHDTRAERRGHNRREHGLDSVAGSQGEIPGLQESERRMISDDDLKNMIDRIDREVGSYCGELAIKELATELLARRDADRWIPVEERLPETSGEYLVCRGHHKPRVAHWYQGTQNFDGSLELDLAFTHWRPLPEPPEAKP
jgi:hypothetical protein